VGLKGQLSMLCPGIGGCGDTFPVMSMLVKIFSK